VITIRDGALTTKDPSDIRVYNFDWGTTALAVDVSIVTSTFTLEGISGELEDDPLTKDSESIVAGDRDTQLRLAGGAAGSRWRIHNQIVTNESPSQTIERSFFLLVQQQ
jgi:hypothetical protein